MDPYDDFDPHQYVYESDDGEGHIEYLEDDVSGDKDPFLPYLAKGVEFSQSQPSQPLQLQIELPNLLPRHERQRRRAAAETTMNREPSDSESSDRDEQDAFSSLQLLLEKQSHQKQKTSSNAVKQPLNQHRQYEASHSPDAPKNSPTAEACTDAALELVVDGEPQERASCAETENAAVYGSEDTAIMGLEQKCPQDVNRLTQAEFPLPDDWDMSQVTQATPGTTAPLVSATQKSIPANCSTLEQELQRQRKRNQGPRPNLASKQVKNRTRTAQGRGSDWSKRRSVGSTPTREKALSQTTGSKALSASIVGSRPQHWGASRTSAARPASWVRNRAASPRSSHFTASLQKTRPTSSSFSQPNRCSSLSSLTTQTPAKVSTEISFAPPFIHSRMTRNAEDAVEEGQASQSRNGQAAIQPYQTPRILQRFNEVSTAAYSAGSGNTPNSGNQRWKRKATKKLKAGPLMKRLRAIRSAIDGDKVRFQSGMYPFSQSANRRFDLSDPRNRASSYMDVTIVGDPVPWVENERVTVLGFIHVIERLSKRSTNDDDIRDLGLTRSSCFAWLCFTYETAREQKLHKGSLLRIYNAICVPARTSIVLDGLVTEHAVKDRCCDQLILSTELCESYPDCLPALPSVLGKITADNEHTNTELG